MITILISLLLLLVGIFFPNNSKFSILGWMFLGWLSISAPKEYLSDYSTYNLVYNNLSSYSGTFEVGYTQLEYFANNFGLTFDQFRSIFVISALLMMYLGIRRFTKNHALFLVMYLLTFYGYDLIQMRSQFMMGSVLLGYSVLISEKISKLRLICAIFIIYLGSLIHTSGYIFLVALFIYIFIKKFDNILNIALPGATILLFVMPLIYRSGIVFSIVDFLGRFTGRNVLADKLLISFTGGMSIRVEFIYFFAILISWLMVKSIRLQVGHNNEINKIVSVNYNILLCGTLVAFWGFSLLGIAPDYSRLYRHGITFVFIMIAYYFEQKNNFYRQNSKRSLIMILLIPLIFINFYVTSLSWGPEPRENVPYLLHIR